MISMSCRINGGDFDLGGQATRRLKEHLARLGVSGAVMRRAMIAAYEAEMNVVIHARTGTLWARLDACKLDLEVADEGPGIPDLQLAQREGWSTASAKAREMGFGAGMGLPNIRRNSDLFDIETRPGRGTRIRSTIFFSGGPADPSRLPSLEEEAVAISPERCRRCLRCIFSCPTGALRVHAAGPVLRTALCIGCTECASACANGVYGIRDVSAETPPAAVEGAVVVLPRWLLASPRAGRSPAEVLGALAGLGFTEVRFTEEWEDAIQRAARELASRTGASLPVISPVCPAVTALVESRFPSLIPNLAMLASPLEAAGEEFPLSSAVLVAACPSQLVSAGRSSLTERLTVLTPARLCEALRGVTSPSERRPSLRAPREPLSPAQGELSISGARGVLRALAAAEAGALDSVPLLSLRLCPQGCAGSPLVSPDPLLTALGCQRITPLLLGAPESDAAAVPRPRPYSQRAGMRLGTDMASAIQALGRIDQLSRTLPGRDCGACGAPACALYAEDVVMGRAESSSCPHASLVREVSP
jgi:serine/threonine-protein kinase RsbT